MFNIILGDFNSQSPTWCTDEKRSIEDTRLDVLSSFHGPSQLITEPIQLKEQSASHIDLTFTNLPNLVIDRVVHPSPPINCHHKIVYYKLNLNIKFPQPYEC